jgi:MFS family permease
MESKIMQRIILQTHQWLVRIFMAGLVLQFYLAGAPIFGVQLSFAPHRMLGFALTIAAILFLVLALVGRLGRKLIGFSILLVSLTIVQAILPAFRGHAPWIAALHPVNALVLMGVSAAIRRYGHAEAPQTN